MLGGSSNIIGPGGNSEGSVMVGGNANSLDAQYSSILGGSNNFIQSGAGGTSQNYVNTIVGGTSQIIGDTVNDINNSSIFGGVANQNLGLQSTIIGGESNTIAPSATFATNNLIANGFLNNINGSGNTILGGSSNAIEDGAGQNIIVGGNGNTIRTNLQDNILVGGVGNQASGSAYGGAVVAGFSNKVLHQYSVVVGGSNLSTTADNQVVVPDLQIASSATLFGAGGGAYYTTGSQEYGLGKSLLSIESDPGSSGIYTDAFNIFNLEITDTKDSFKVDVDVTGSVSISEVLTLKPQGTLPVSGSGATIGMIAVSGSVGNAKPYFFDGTAWNALF